MSCSMLGKHWSPAYTQGLLTSTCPLGRWRMVRQPMGRNHMRPKQVPTKASFCVSGSISFACRPATDRVKVLIPPDRRHGPRSLLLRSQHCQHTHQHMHGKAACPLGGSSD